MGLCGCGKEFEGDAQQCERCRALAELDLIADADAAQIEGAYRRIVEEWQPRRQDSDPKMRRIAEVKLAAVKAAHALLISEEPVTAASKNEDASETTDAIVAEETPSRRSDALKHPMLQRGAILVALVFALTAGVLAIDFVLSNTSATAPAYTTFKTNLKNAFRARLEDWKKPSSGKSASTSAQNHPADEATVSGKHAGPPAAHESDSSLMRDLADVPHASGTQAYVTLGLTPREVAAVLGPPTSASSKALIYRSSVIYLRDGFVSGWKVDPAAHMPVRLWPRHAVDPELDTFTTGSTKDQVIFVQGTPTLVTDDKFGYGDSQVFFQGGRVVGWLNSPGSVPLKVHEE